MSFRPDEAGRGYAFEVIEDIEDQNCSRGRGCVHGARPGSADWSEVGPGGSCPLLAVVSLGDEPVEGMDLDEAGRVTCHRYVQRAAVLDAPRPAPIPAGQLLLFADDPRP